MTVSEKAWEEYISRMRGVNAAVSEQVQQYLENNIIQYDFDRRAAVRYIHALVTKYSEAAAALSCQMYDALGGLSSTLRRIPEAEPAEGPTYEDTARMVYKTLETGNPKTVGDAAARLVKRRAVDTTMQNAIRDGAEWAWIPHGDTCAFCITLASRGWQKASKKALKNGHADHIHDHCDCTYAVRFDKDTTVEGYDPEKYRAMYDAAEGGTPTEKINAMRRADYAQRKDEINAQKRTAYAERVERERGQNTEQSASTGPKVPNKQKEMLSESKPISQNDVTDEYIEKARPGEGTLTVEDQEHTTTHAEEISIAKLIHEKLGGGIIVRKERSGVENADYLWHGKLWELKTPDGDKNLSKLIQKGLSQIYENPGGIVVDISNISDDDRVMSIINGRMKTSMKHTTDVMIVKNGQIERIWRYKK